MSLLEGKRMTEYKKIRKEYGTTTYNRIVAPNRLDEYILYLRDMTEIRELDKEKKQIPIQKKNIQIIKKKDTLFDLLTEKDQPDEKKSDEKKSDEKKSDEKKSDGKTSDEKTSDEKTLDEKKILKITSSLEPEKQKNPLNL